MSDDLKLNQLEIPEAALLDSDAVQRSLRIAQPKTPSPINIDRQLVGSGIDGVIGKASARKVPEPELYVTPDGRIK